MADNREKNITNSRVFVFQCTNSQCASTWNAWTETDDICGYCGCTAKLVTSKVIPVSTRKYTHNDK